MSQTSVQKPKKKNNFKSGKKAGPQDDGGPGSYNPDAANYLTKSRVKSATMSKLGRPDINKRVESGTGDLGPGSYDDGKGFGKGVKGHGFGKPRPEKSVVDNRDYGTGDLNKTRSKSPAALINRNTPARPKSFALDTNEGGPG